MHFYSDSKLVWRLHEAESVLKYPWINNSLEVCYRNPTTLYPREYWRHASPCDPHLLMYNLQDVGRTFPRVLRALSIWDLFAIIFQFLRPSICICILPTFVGTRCPHTSAGARWSSLFCRSTPHRLPRRQMWRHCSPGCTPSGLPRLQSTPATTTGRST